MKISFFLWRKKEKEKKKSVDPGFQNFCKTSGIPSGYVTRGKWSRTLPITIIRVGRGFSILLFRFSMKFIMEDVELEILLNIRKIFKR